MLRKLKLLKLIFKLSLFLVVIIAILIPVMKFDAKVTSIQAAYNSLSNKPLNSKDNFNKKVGYIVRQENGDYSYTFEFVNLQNESKIQDSTYVIDSGTLIYNIEDFQKVEEALAVVPELGKNKAKTLALAWDTLSQVEEYSPEFKIGLLANISCEGDFGQLEHRDKDTVIENWDGRGNSINLKTSGAYIRNVDNLKAVINHVENGPNLWFGVGIIQWSYESRKEGLIKAYKEAGLTENIYADETAFLEALARVELNYFLKELNGYKKSIEKELNKHNCIANSPADYAAAVCDVYEKPSMSCSMQYEYYKDWNTDKMSTYVKALGKGDSSVSKSVITRTLLEGHNVGEKSSWSCGKRIYRANLITEALNDYLYNQEIQAPESTTEEIE